jgi:hypothetical protein
MELNPLNLTINNFKNFTNYNINSNDFYNGYDNIIDPTNQEDWGFFGLDGLIKDKNSSIKDENISAINQNDPIGNEYDQLINGKSTIALQQSINNPEIPTEVDAPGSTSWNGNYCFYGNLPYRYSYHSNDLSCNINSCKNVFTVNPTKNQFKCPQTILTNYGITPLYAVDFSFIQEFFNAIGFVFHIEPRDNLHWAIYYPLMVILYLLNPWITFFSEPWINFLNSIQFFVYYHVESFFLEFCQIHTAFCLL